MTLEQKYNNRRKRVARRFFRQSPLFALELMHDVYPDYTPEQFNKDLPLKKRSSKKVKFVRSGRIRFGRWDEIQNLVHQYKTTKDIAALFTAQKLLQRIAKPFIVYAKFDGKIFDYSFPPTTSLSFIKSVVEAANKTQDKKFFEAWLKEKMRYQIAG